MRIKFIYSSKLTGKTRKPATTNKHRVSFIKQAQKIIDRADIVLEVLDVRFIDKTRNVELEEKIRVAGKKLVYILNKADLIDVNELKLNYDLTKISPYVLVSTHTEIGRARLRKLILIESKRIKFPQVRVGVIGYPNTGKSSLINVLAGGKKASTSPIAGKTKTIQEIRFRKNILLLDSPGVITGGEENSINAKVVTRQTEIGAKDYTKTKYPDLILNEIMLQDKTVFDRHYGIDSGGDTETLLEKLGEQWKFLKKKGEIDTDRAARRVLKDWQEGKIKTRIR